MATLPDGSGPDKLKGIDERQRDRQSTPGWMASRGEKRGPVIVSKIVIRQRSRHPLTVRQNQIRPSIAFFTQD
jgi:hypothetical protein